MFFSRKETDFIYLFLTFTKKTFDQSLYPFSYFSRKIEDVQNAADRGEMNPPWLNRPFKD